MSIRFTGGVMLAASSCFIVAPVVAGEATSQTDPDVVIADRAGPRAPGQVMPQESGAVNVYDLEADFFANLPGSKSGKGVEDFEEAVAPLDIGFVPSPLCSDVPNPPVFPDGMIGLSNLCVEAAGGPGPTLVLRTPLSALGPPPSNMISAEFNIAATVLTFDEPKTAVSLSVHGFGVIDGPIFVDSGTDVLVEFFDTGGALIGSATASGVTLSTPTFLGAIAHAGVTIGSVRLDALDPGGDGIVDFEYVDDIRTWATAVTECEFDMAFPLDDFGKPFSFVGNSEAADDFVLGGDTMNDCLLDEVTFSISLAGSTAGADTPEACWDGVVVRVFDDASGSPGAIRWEIVVPMSNLLSTALSLPCQTSATSPDFEVTLFGISSLETCMLEKERVYWLSVRPLVTGPGCGFPAMFYSERDFGAPAVRRASDADPWLTDNGNLGTCPGAPPAGTKVDFAIRVSGTKALGQIPTVSEWGLIVLGLLLLTAGTIVIRRMKTQPHAA